MKADETIEFNGQRLRPVSLDEWMMPLQPDHPARQALDALRTTATAALVRIDHLEKENSALSAEIAKLRGNTPPPPAPPADDKAGFPEV